MEVECLHRRRRAVPRSGAVGIVKTTGVDALAWVPHAFVTTPRACIKPVERPGPPLSARVVRSRKT